MDKKRTKCQNPILWLQSSEVDIVMSVTLKTSFFDGDAERRYPRPGKLRMCSDADVSGREHLPQRPALPRSRAVAENTPVLNLNYVCLNRFSETNGAFPASGEEEPPHPRPRDLSIRPDTRLK